MKTIHINCDLGEELYNEDLLMPFISACNIACGGHAGNKEIIENTIDLAIQHQVQIGAHPSFPDRENFGRKVLQIEDNELLDSLVNQISVVLEIANKKNTELHHIKAHGALYNLAAKDQRTAEILIEAIKRTSPNAVIFVPPKSIIANLAIKEGFNISFEVFCDRNYNDDFSLVNRKEASAVFHDPADVLQHVNRLHTGELLTRNGIILPIQSDTFCVHGDTNNAVAILEMLNSIYKVEKL